MIEWAAIKAFFSGAAWKLGAFAGIAGCVVMAGFLIAAKVETSHLTKERDALETSINAPGTGYAARLAQVNTNYLTVDAALKLQNAAVAAQSARDKTALDATQAKLDAAQATIAKLNDRAAATLAYHPKGDTACERSTDVINHYLGGLQ